MAAKPTKVPVVPKTFSGKATEDPDHYLIAFDRAAKCNNWTEDCKMTYLPVYLEGTANFWYQNWFKNQAVITWKSLETAFKKAFNSVAKTEVAEQKLQARKQLLGETPEDYIYEMIDLCAKADPAMPVAKQVRTIIKGLRPSYLEKVHLLDPQTIGQLLEAVRKVHEAKYLVEVREESVMAVQPVLPVSELSSWMAQVDKTLREQASMIRNVTAPRNMGQSTYGRGRGRINNRGDARQLVCWNCSQPGHLKSQCTARQAQAQQCRYCHIWGHIERDCRKKQAAFQQGNANQRK